MTTTRELRKGVFLNLQQQTFADEYTQPFWDAAKEDRLAVPRCTACGTFRLPPLPLCYACQSKGIEWVQLPGTGTVYTYTVVHHPLSPELSAICPYVSGVVELDGTQGAGARMLVNIIDCDPETITIGTRVQIEFDHLNAEMSTPRFHPIQELEH